VFFKTCKILSLSVLDKVANVFVKNE